MENTLILNQPLSFTRRLVLTRKFSFSAFWIITFLIFLVLLAFYIFQANSIISEGYQIQNYQRKLNELRSQNEILEINLAQNNSLGNIEAKIQELGFEKVGQVHYIRVLESQIVTK